MRNVLRQLHVYNLCYLELENVQMSTSSSENVVGQIVSKVKSQCVNRGAFMSRGDVRKVSIFQHFVLLILFSVTKQSLGNDFGVPL